MVGIVVVGGGGVAVGCAVGVALESTTATGDDGASVPVGVSVVSSDVELAIIGGVCSGKGYEKRNPAIRKKSKNNSINTRFFFCLMISSAL